jgi:hypothetical protein
MDTQDPNSSPKSVETDLGFLDEPDSESEPASAIKRRSMKVYGKISKLKKIGVEPRRLTPLEKYYMLEKITRREPHMIILGVFGHGGPIMVKTSKGLKIQKPVPIKPVVTGHTTLADANTPYANLVKISLAKRGEYVCSIPSIVTNVNLYLKKLFEDINIEKDTRKIEDNDVKNYFDSILNMDMRKKEILDNYLRLADELRGKVNHRFTRLRQDRLVHPFLHSVLKRSENPIGHFEVNSIDELNNKGYVFNGKRGRIPLKILYNSHQKKNVGNYHLKRPDITLQQLYEMFAGLGYKHIIIFDFGCDKHTVPGALRRGGYENTKKRRSKKTKGKYSESSYTKKRRNKQ